MSSVAGNPAPLADSSGAQPGATRSLLPSEMAGAIACGVLLALSFALKLLPITLPATIAAWGALGVGLVYGGVAALEALRERKVDIDVLMVVGAVLAACIGHPEDGALLLFLFVLSGALEDRAMRRTMRAVEALHKLMPTRAMVWRDGAWAETEPAALSAGDRVLIRAGELVPADARLDKGRTSMDQATLTGESLPRTVAEGDELYAGTLNVGHPIEAVITKPARESSLQKVLDLVMSAQQQREPLQRVIDRFSEPYAVGVMLTSLAVFAIWKFLLGAPSDDAAYTAIALLIVASPCALVIATPTATLAGISRGARAGLLFKGGQSIERLANLGSVCLDKTGTLTLGKPRLQQVHAIGWSDGGLLLSAAAALEAGSTHPIAVAVVEAARARGVAPGEALDIQDLPGKGLAGTLTLRGRAVSARLGTMEHCEEFIPVCLRARAREVLEKIRARGQIGVVIAIADAGPAPTDQGALPGETGQAAVMILSDAIRPGAREMVDRLHELGVRPVRMLTGDHAVTAAHVASRLGIDRYDAALLPQDKVRLLQEAKEESRRAGDSRVARGVGVIGDGVNDAPALAAADVSIAIGSIGSDAALESADIVLLNDDLRVIPWGVRLARRTRAIVKFNIVFALSIIACMGAATLIGSRTGWRIPLALAVLAHEGGTLLVVMNSLRLLLARRPDGKVVEVHADESPALVPATVEA